MGLDMYLDRDVYPSFDYYPSSWDKEQGLRLSALPANVFPADVDGRIEKVTLRIAYWRKANAVHGWFVRNCAGGVDECQRIDVSAEELIELREIAQRLLDAWGTDEFEDLADATLPPTTGFFFGRYEYDDWYRQDLLETVEQLKDVQPDEYGYYYQASW